MAKYPMIRTTVSAAVLTTMLTACGGYIKQEQYDNDMAELRSELNDQIAAGDQQVGDAANRRMDALESQLQSLQSDLGSLSSNFDAKIAQMEGRLYVEMPVFFAFDESTIRDGDKPALDQFATVIREHHPNVIVTVEGFTDPAGDSDYNQWLGQQRADAVREYLVQQGQLNGENVRAVSYGEASNRQVVPGAWGDEGLANRRVTLVIELVG
ncbi:MAG: OmpA family protein [Gemmatimonadota bacterium]|nr:MAG: OmpA family protein [Gemmatimonadota bacterium]